VNGGEVRTKQFSLALFGYSVADVDTLLKRVESVIEANHSPVPVIKETKLRKTLKGYEIDQVDEFLRDCVSAGAAGTGGEWRGVEKRMEPNRRPLRLEEAPVRPAKSM
jgi:DivIVA domain-containing protein